ncbi:MAG: LysR family transcriptional regulator [Oscillospiraceae bacterium]|jgi:DNA-binding transcriptional LysR family regulator|nr:LysR family transcriptional regulator [Oscillospiraceae bacterium]MCI1991097.1 LysR family transcriptional regulator [Oscillospiraceae bacterium]MCI2036321.1 LysR family transcriptional regulator [Oscillospiraceae bacterium]
MTLQQLKYVIKIVEYGSITEAAKRLYITQPSLSSAVKELEKELGIEIFSRSSRGVSLTVDGAEFLSYARQVVEQEELLERRYTGKKPSRRLCAISTQHYAFSVNAFVELVKECSADEYEFTLRETRTYDIIQDVKNMRSEIGILYLNHFNEKVITKLLREDRLEFHPLFEASPHVFVSWTNPLSTKEFVTLKDLEEYPCLSFEQGEFNSFYFSEEILSTVYHKKSIHVSDRATLFNLLIGLNGYTICTGVLSSDLNGVDIVSIPLAVSSDERMRIGWIVNSKAVLSSAAESYIGHLKKLIRKYGFTIIE